MNMKKRISLLVAAMLLMALLPAAAFAKTDSNLSAQSGGLLISEAGAYTLTGSMRGTVWVDPGAGDVTLILDNITIDGGEGTGIAAISGDSLTVILADGSANSVRDGGSDPTYNAAIYCAVPTRFEGSGRLDVTGTNGVGIRGVNADLTFASGSYYVAGKAGSVKTDGRLSVLNAMVMDLNSNQLLASATPQKAVQTGSSKTDSTTNPYLASAKEAGVESASDEQQTASEIPASEPQAASNEPAAEPVPAPETPAAEPQTASNEPAAEPQTAPEAPAAEPQTASNEPADNPPQKPEQQNGQANQDSVDPPQMPGNPNGQPQNGGMPASETLTSTAEEPGEIVTSTAVNNAATLEADLENAEYITVSDENSQVKISDSGTYVVTGESSDGNITVKKGTTGVVLVLDDLDLTSTTGATVSVNKEAEVKIIISGNVTLTDAENPEDENSADEAIADAFDGAAMKFKANSQVYLTGDGVLTINGSAKNGIKTGDESSLVIDGEVTVNITAANDGINGNYDVTLLNGDFTITAGDDAIHADHILTVGSADGSGPDIRINSCTEGLEGTVVNVFGGNISISATDDAINAANGDGLYEGVLDYSFNMTGGSVTVSSQGDGIDSNGNVNLLGGSATISSASMGGEAGIDYDGDLYVSDDFELNNASGVAGPDEMPGGMNGPMGGPMNDQMNGEMSPMNGQMNGEMGPLNGPDGMGQPADGMPAMGEGRPGRNDRQELPRMNP